MKKSEEVLDREELISNFRRLYDKGNDLASSEKYEDIARGLDYFLEALPICERLDGHLDCPNTAKVLSKIGDMYQDLGGVDNYLKSLHFYQRALAMYQGYYGDTASLEIVKALDLVSAAYAILDGNANKEKSLEFANKALEMCQVLYLGQPHPDIINSLWNVAKAYDAIGNDESLSKSIDLLQQALEIAKSSYGEQPHYHTAHILNSMGIHYQKLEGLDNANKGLASFQESLDMCQKLDSRANPELARAFNNIGVSYQRLMFIDPENGSKYMVHSLENIKKALEINQELYGDHPHPYLAKSMQDLSISYTYLGEVDNMKHAYQLQKQALAMYQKLYPTDHPDIMGCLNNLNYIINQHSFESYDDMTLANAQDLNKDSASLTGNIGSQEDVV